MQDSCIYVFSRILTCFRNESCAKVLPRKLQDLRKVPLSMVVRMDLGSSIAKKIDYIILYIIFNLLILINIIFYNKLFSYYN